MISVRRWLAGLVVLTMFGLWGVVVAAQIQDKREYTIGIGDQLSIQIWEIPELSGTVSVRYDGKMTLPRLGDVQAAGLKVSSLRKYLAGVEKGKETIGKYVKDPQITITVVKPSENVRLIFSGVISRRIDAPRGITIAQVLSQVIPSLPADPHPDLAAIRVISAEGEVFPVDWQKVQTEMGENIRLEWGDEIHIPSKALPTPTPIIQATPTPTPSVIYTREELQEILQDVPEKLDLVLAAAEQLEDGSYSFNISDISDEQKASIGEELLTRLLGKLPPPPVVFTDATLVGLNINLAIDDVVEAYLAFPASEPDALPRIERFRENDLIEKGPSEEENIYLDKIIDSSGQVVLRKGEAIQTLILSKEPFSKAKFSGVLTGNNQKKAFFSGLNRPESKKPAQRSFIENEEIEEGVVLAKITDQWALLKKDDNIQLALLRDSFNRPLPQSQSDQTPTPEPGAETTEVAEDVTVPTEMLKKSLPEPLKALDAFSELFFATPVF